MTEEAQAIIDKQAEIIRQCGDKFEGLILADVESRDAILAAASKPKGPFPLQMGDILEEQRFAHLHKDGLMLTHWDQEVKLPGHCVDQLAVAWLMQRGVDLQDLYIDVLENRIDRDEDDAIRAILKNAEEN